MARSSDRGRGSSAWLLIAGAILALQGLATIIYSGFIPPPITDAGVEVPLLGHLAFVWMVVGGVAIAAAFGVLRGRTWGRYLGTVSEILSLATALVIAPSLTAAAFALVLPGFVLFVLWRRWPATSST